jgi:hypothetical protein
VSGSSTLALDRIINESIENRLYRMFGGWLPGLILSYDETSGRADVQILVKDVDRDESDEPQAKSFAMLTNRPVMFPGSGGARFKFPISKGDKCTVFFAARAVDKFLHIGDEVAPDSERHHHLSDGLVIPGLEITAVDAALQVEVTDDEVRLGGADERVATAKDFYAHLFEVLTDPDVLAGIAAAVGDGGTSLTTALTVKLVSPGTRVEFGTTKVKAGV